MPGSTGSSPSCHLLRKDTTMTAHDNLCFTHVHDRALSPEECPDCIFEQVLFDHADPHWLDSQVVTSLLAFAGAADEALELVSVCPEVAIDVIDALLLGAREGVAGRSRVFLTPDLPAAAMVECGGAVLFVDPDTLDDACRQALIGLANDPDALDCGYELRGEGFSAIVPMALIFRLVALACLHDLCGPG